MHGKKLSYTIAARSESYATASENGIVLANPQI